MSIRDLLLRDNLFEIITGSRTFYVQVQSATHQRLRCSQVLCHVGSSLGEKHDQIQISLRGGGLFSQVYRPLFSLNALLLLCGKGIFF